MSIDTSKLFPPSGSAVQQHKAGAGWSWAGENRGQQLQCRPQQLQRGQHQLQCGSLLRRQHAQAELAQPVPWPSVSGTVQCCCGAGAHFEWGQNRNVKKARIQQPFLSWCVTVIVFFKINWCQFENLDEVGFGTLTKLEILYRKLSKIMKLNVRYPVFFLLTYPVKSGDVIPFFWSQACSAHSSEHTSFLGERRSLGIYTIVFIFCLSYF